MLTLQDLQRDVEAGRVDTVLVAMTDMQGRLQGKRLHARYFLDVVGGQAGSSFEGCDYLLAVPSCHGIHRIVPRSGRHSRSP